MIWTIFLWCQLVSKLRAGIFFYASVCCAKLIPKYVLRPFVVIALIQCVQTHRYWVSFIEVCLPPKRSLRQHTKSTSAAHFFLPYVQTPDDSIIFCFFPEEGEFETLRPLASHLTFIASSNLIFSHLFPKVKVFEQVMYTNPLAEVHSRNLLFFLPLYEVTKKYPKKWSGEAADKEADLGNVHL